jgi:hypothetical protein
MLLLLAVAQSVAATGPAAVGGLPPLVCHAASLAELANCTYFASRAGRLPGQNGRPTPPDPGGRARAIAVSGMLEAPPSHWAPLNGPQVLLINATAPVLIYGDGSPLSPPPTHHGDAPLDSQHEQLVSPRLGGIRRANASMALLQIVDCSASVRVLDMQFEEPQRGRCYDPDRCGWSEGSGCAGQVLGRATQPVLRSCARPQRSAVCPCHLF